MTIGPCAYFKFAPNHQSNNVNGKCGIFKCWIQSCHEVCVSEKQKTLMCTFYSTVKVHQIPKVFDTQVAAVYNGETINDLILSD